MGFDEKTAKKALKVTGDVTNAVTLLLESTFNFEGVSDSEEEQKPSDEQIKAEEEDKKKAEELLAQERESLITVTQFKEFVKFAQEKGLEAVSGWSNFPAEQVKFIPLKTQRKYLDLYDQYVINLARSSNQTPDDLKKIFDKIYNEYTSNVSRIESNSSSLNIDQITSLFQDTKNKLSLLHRLTKIENCESMLRSQRKDSLQKLIENVVKTIKAITASQLRSGADKQNFYYVSNTQELLYKSLLLLLVYLQTLNSKKAKYEAALQKEGAGETSTKK